MQEFYDVIIVGAGPMGIFTAYELMVKAPKLSVLLVDKGHDIHDRKCPILSKAVSKCPVDKNGWIGCKPACSMTNGFGGCGAYSDGKFNITAEFGGWMTNYLDSDEVLELIRYVDAINLAHGAPQEITDPLTKEVHDIERRGIAVGLKLLRSNVRHLGTEVNLQILKNIHKTMKDGISYKFKTKIEDVLIDQGRVVGVVTDKLETIKARYVVLGVGRDGSSWLQGILETHGVTFKNNQVDLGVRVETNDIIMEEINKNLYEGKFIFNTSVGTTVRTFCSNPSGHVVLENHSGAIICNGHAYHDQTLGSKNTNFALLVSHEFDEPFDNPNEFAIEISKLANKLSDGTVIVQKYGDLKKGRRSTPKRIAEGFVRPTLKEAVPGDLGLVLPYNTMKSLIEMTEALNHVTPGIASDHTLFYGVEAKYYSARPEVNREFETTIHGLYVGGDGAGITRGLAQAGANGIKVARSIVQKENKID